MKLVVPTVLALSALVAALACSGTNEPATTNQAPVGTTPLPGAVAPVGSAMPTVATPGTAAPGVAPPAAPVAGADPNLGNPPCDLSTNAAGMEIKKGTSCDVAAGDPQVCYRKCGPAGTGWKTETCTAGAYAEGKCAFPSSNGEEYSCYAIPATQHASCPLTLETLPKAGNPCDVPVCNLCNVQGQYANSSGSVKVGHCVCQEPSATGARTWTCASGTAWPCPLGNGC